MDGGFKSKRLFPSYTTDELKARVGSVADPVTRSKMETEIAAREAGLSKPLIVPQVPWGRAVPKIGRM